MTRPDVDAEEAARQAAAQQRLEDTLLDAAYQLGRIRAEWPLVITLGDSRQSGLGFVPADVRARMGAAYAEQKAEQRARPTIPGRGLGVLLDDGGAAGASPLPGNLSAWSLSAELALMLRGWVRRIVDDHRAGGGTAKGLAVVVGTLPAEPSDRQLVDHLRELLWTITNTGRARTLAADLAHYADRLGDLVDGEHRRDLPGACPWCGRRTLVLYLESGIIRCERPRAADGLPEPCRCASSVCGCQTDPRWTHTWLRESSSRVTSWTALAGRLQLQRRAGTDPTPPTTPAPRPARRTRTRRSR